MPLGHIGLNVSDLERSRSYYRHLLPVLGFEQFLDHHDEFAWRPADGKVGTYLFFYPSNLPAPGGSVPYSRERTGLQHLAFIVNTRASVAEVCALADGLGSTMIHEPQDWPQYPPPYHAGFWLDPDGFLLEAVCHKDA